MIRQVQFLGKNKVIHDYHIGKERLNQLEPLSKINLFVGPNNSGKSRFLRELVKEFHRYQAYNPDDTFPKLPGESTDHISLILTKRADLIQNIQVDFDALGPFKTYKEEIATLDNLLPNSEYLNEYQLQRFLGDINIAYRNQLRATKASPITTNPAPEKIEEHVQNIKAYLISLFPLPRQSKFTVNYVPVFRTLKAFMLNKADEPANYLSYIKREEFEDIKQPIFRIRTLWDYFMSERKDDDRNNAEIYYDSDIYLSNIFTGEKLYKIIKELHNGTEDRREILSDFEQFLSEQFFNNEKVVVNALTVNKIDNIYVKVGKEREYPIHQLGDGIQAIIILTFPLFYYKGHPAHILVYEEPELNLHPGMQRIFIEAIRKFANVQTFIATHSNHLLDVSVDYPADISIFSIEKKLNGKQAVFQLENLSSPGRPLLDLLGIRNSSVFLSNCCIWVEGVADRIYLKCFLQVYLKKVVERQKIVFQEDNHYSFLEFGGNNIVHYNFSDSEPESELINAIKITSRIFLVHDKDKGKEKRHQLLRKQLGNNYHCLSVLEIENLLSPAILKQTLNVFRKKGEGDLLFTDFVQQDYAMVNLYELFRDVTDLSKVKKLFSEQTATIKASLLNKADFARTAVSHINSWDDLSPAAQQLTIELYQFIVSHNLS